MNNNKLRTQKLLLKSQVSTGFAFIEGVTFCTQIMSMVNGVTVTKNIKGRSPISS